jgi:hypothetical protein
MTASMKIRVFWDVASFSLEWTDASEVRTASIIIHRPDDGGSRHL